MDKFKKQEMFLGANTGDPKNFGYEGTENELRENYNLQKLYLLKGKNGNGKNTLMNTVAKAFPQNEKDVYLCSGDSISTDAVLIKGGKQGNFGIVDATTPHNVEPKDNGIDEVVDLAQFIDPSKVTVSDKELAEWQAKRLSYYDKSNKYLGEIKTANMSKDVDPKEVQRVFEPIHDMLRQMGVEPTGINIEAFVRSVTSEGIKDLSQGWTTPEKTHYIDAPEEIANQVFNKLKSFGGYSFKHYLKPNQLEGAAIGGHMFKVAPDREMKYNKNTMDLAIEALQGADKETHGLLENVFKPAVDFKGVSQVTQRIIDDNTI